MRDWANASVHSLLCMHGYHVYKYIWTSACGEELQCQCEADNVASMLFPLCDVEPCMHTASWTRHISRKNFNLLICLAKGGRIKLV